MTWIALKVFLTHFWRDVLLLDLLHPRTPREGCAGWTGESVVPTATRAGRERTRVVRLRDFQNEVAQRVSWMGTPKGSFFHEF